jgi:putative aldouronate transport system substrate-binding protein
MSRKRIEVQPRKDKETMSRKLTRRQFIQSGTLATAAGILAACAPQATPTAAPEQPTAAPTAAPAEPTATTAAAAAAQPTATVAPAPVAEKLTGENTNLDQLVKLTDTKISVKGFSSPLDTETNVKTFNDQVFDKKMEELTNVHVTWTAASDWGAAPFELLMASGDIPDMISGFDLNLYAKYGQKGALAPLNDYINNSAYLKKLIDASPRIRALITAPDGKIYGFPRVLSQVQEVFGGFFIRQDWLDEIGAQIPTTLDEYHTVLTELKKKDSKRYPLSCYMGDGTSGTFNHIMWQFGIGVKGPNYGYDLYHDGDTIKFGPMQPEFHDALVYINTLWKEGLMDPQYTTVKQDPTVLYKRWSDGIVGVGFGWADDLNAIMKLDPKINLMPMKPPKGPNGHQEVLSNHFEIDPTEATALSASGKYKDILAKYVDLFYSDSGTDLMYWGIYGDSYTEKDGVKTYTDKVMKDSKLVPGQVLWNYYSPYWIGAMFCPTDSYLALYPGRGGEAIKLWSEAPWETIKMPDVFLTDDENSAIQQPLTDINTLLAESTTAFITGKKNLDADFKKMQSQLQSIGVDEIVKTYQAAYDRFKANLKS